MHAMNVTQARAKLFQLIANVNFNSEPITLTNSKGKNAVLIGEDDWNAIHETLYLNSIPGMYFCRAVLNESKNKHFSELS